MFLVFNSAVVDRERDQSTADDDYFRGVPEIVIEVLSPSNTAPEMLEREAICLRHGGREFWRCDPVQRTVKVTTAEGFDCLPRVGVKRKIGSENAGRGHQGDL